MYNNILINDALNKNSGLNNFFTLFDGKTTPGSENVSLAVLELLEKFLIPSNPP